MYAAQPARTMEVLYEKWRNYRIALLYGITHYVMLCVRVPGWNKLVRRCDNRKLPKNLSPMSRRSIGILLPTSLKAVRPLRHRVRGARRQSRAVFSFKTILLNSINHHNLTWSIPCTRTAILKLDHTTGTQKRILKPRNLFVKDLFREVLNRRRVKKERERKTLSETSYALSLYGFHFQIRCK